MTFIWTWWAWWRLAPDGTLGQSCETEVLDEDELDEALNENRITPQQHALAWAEARAVLAALDSQTFKPLDVLRRYLQDPYT